MKFSSVVDSIDDIAPTCADIALALAMWDMFNCDIEKLLINSLSNINAYERNKYNTPLIPPPIEVNELRLCHILDNNELSLVVFAFTLA
jgi:hypothetical protein